ncbi:hypothetical protein D918_06049 [Trichuris suis]|nr:hypothetical protein D918_06049 [Trichuris suis]
MAPCTYSPYSYQPVPNIPFTNLRAHNHRQANESILMYANVAYMFSNSDSAFTNGKYNNSASFHTTTSLNKFYSVLLHKKHTGLLLRFQLSEDIKCEYLTTFILKILMNWHSEP